MNGTTWLIDSVHHIIDGDTLTVTRSRDLQLGDDWFDIADLKPKSIRLVWVDTPERGDHPGYEKAREDLSTWLAVSLMKGDVHVICYESAGWDRLLGDLIDVDGQSASQWLMTERGWSPYVKGK
jgi:endonuclease YncB( thermonuclease family)